MNTNTSKNNGTSAITFGLAKESKVPNHDQSELKNEVNNVQEAMSKLLKEKTGDWTVQDQILRERARPHVMKSDEVNVIEVDYILANYSRKLNQSPSPTKKTKQEKPNAMIR